MTKLDDKLQAIMRDLMAEGVFALDEFYDGSPYPTNPYRDAS